jgi:hypothetical protein
MDIAVPAPGAVTGNIATAPTLGIYRVGPSPGYALTLLFAMTAASQSATVLTGATTLTFTGASASQPDIILEPGETLHCGVIVVSTQTAGLAGATVTNTQTIPTGTGGFIQAPTGLTDLFISTLTGAASQAGTIANKVSKFLAGSSTQAGVVTKVANRFLTGAVATIASTLIRTDKKLVGALNTPSATLVKVDKKLTTSSITPAATVKPAVVKVFTAAIASGATVKRTLVRNLNGVIGSSSFLRKVYAKNLAGFLYGPAGSGNAVINIIKRPLNAIFDD